MNSKEMKRFDVIIPVARKDIGFVPRVVDFVTRCINDIDNIYIITSLRNVNILEKKLCVFRCCHVIDENRMVDGLSFETVSYFLNKYAPHRIDRTGWYFQQFLKLAFAKSSYSSQYYLSWDADTLPLAPIEFFEENHILFNPKKEYNTNYFDTIEKLFGFGKVVDYSFISEGMMFSSEIVREMLGEIDNCRICGESWIEKIIAASDFSTSFPAFSEFETYGSYCHVKHKGLYIPRHLNTFREANMICGKYIGEERLRLLSFDVDIVSFEKGHVPPFPYNIIQKIDGFMETLDKNPAALISKIKKKFTKEEVDVNMEKMLYRLPPKANL